MSNTDNITKNMGVGPVGVLTSGEGTLDVNTGTFGVVSKSNAMTDGVSVATASRNMAEVYNRILLDMASCLDLAVKVGDPANPGAFGNLLPAGAVDARDIGENWTPVATMAYVLKQGIDGLKGAVSSLSSQVAGLAQGAALYTFTGSVQYENLTNTITATGIGDDCEVGDVIKVTGTVKNNKLFTIESKVSSDKVIVNAAHAHDKGPLSLKDETLTSKVELLTKWYNAPSGLGQAWVNVTAARDVNPNATNINDYITYPSLCGGNRPMALRVIADSQGSDRQYVCIIDGRVVYELIDDFTAGIPYVLVNVGASSYGVKVQWHTLSGKLRWYELR